MKLKSLAGIGICACITLGSLTSCGLGLRQKTGAQATAQAAVATPTALPTAAPLGTSIPLSSTIDLNNAPVALGEVRPAQDAELMFAVQGTVEKVLVEEGQQVKAGQELAVLDLRPFDQSVAAAQAQVDQAKAKTAALTSPPSAAQVSAAKAQVRQAEIALRQAQSTEPADVAAAQAQMAEAEAALQTQKDTLSRQKTAAEASVEKAATSLQEAQSSYASAKKNWDYVQETGNDPANPSVTDSKTGQKKANKLNDVQQQQYYNAYVQAEAGLRQAEQAVQQAQVDAEQARRNEASGVQAAEQQTNQARAGAQKAQLPSGATTVSMAQAQLDQAKASLAMLYPAPSDADTAQAQASVHQAEAQLAQAQLDRENATLRAPFAGVVDQVNVNPGDRSSTSGSAPFYMVDAGALHVEADVSDIDIGAVAVGQQVHVTSASMIGKEYTGKVTTIASSAQVAGEVRTYRVRIALDASTGLRAGMQVRVVFGGGA